MSFQEDIYIEDTSNVAILSGTDSDLADWNGDGSQRGAPSSSDSPIFSPVRTVAKSVKRRRRPASTQGRRDSALSRHDSTSSASAMYRTSSHEVAGLHATARPRQRSTGGIDLAETVMETGVARFHKQATLTPSDAHPPLHSVTRDQQGHPPGFPPAYLGSAAHRHLRHSQPQSSRGLGSRGGFGGGSADSSRGHREGKIGGRHRRAGRENARLTHIDPTAFDAPVEERKSVGAGGSATCATSVEKLRAPHAAIQASNTQHTSQSSSSSSARKAPATRTRLSQTRKRRRLRVLCEFARSAQDLLRCCAKNMGWALEMQQGSSSGAMLNNTIIWDGRLDEFNFSSMIASHVWKVNRLPGMYQLLWKANLARVFRWSEAYFPHLYNFTPKTWITPDDIEDIRRLAGVEAASGAHPKRKSKIFIVKPDQGSQGGGIALVQGMSKVERAVGGRAMVVQEYIARPLLWDGFKFDLRLYLLLGSVFPCQIYLCREGLVRLCTEPYTDPRAGNLHNTFMHLTNYSLNKMNEKFVWHGDDHDDEDDDSRSSDDDDSDEEDSGEDSDDELQDSGDDGISEESGSDSSAAARRRRRRRRKRRRRKERQRRKRVVDAADATSVCDAAEDMLTGAGAAGSKRTVGALMLHLKAAGIDVDEVWQRIRRVSLLTVLALLPWWQACHDATFHGGAPPPMSSSAAAMSGRAQHSTGASSSSGASGASSSSSSSSFSAAASTASPSPSGTGTSGLHQQTSNKARRNMSAKCFQVIGMDIILDRNFQPWLLELNYNPSFRIDCQKANPDGSVTTDISPVDRYVKSVVMQQTLELVSLKLRDRKEQLPQVAPAFDDLLDPEVRETPYDFDFWGQGVHGEAVLASLMAEMEDGPSLAQYPLRPQLPKPEPPPGPTTTDNLLEFPAIVPPDRRTRSKRAADGHILTPSSVVAAGDDTCSRFSGESDALIVNSDIGRSSSETEVEESSDDGSDKEVDDEADFGEDNKQQQQPADSKSTAPRLWQQATEHVHHTVSRDRDSKRPSGKGGGNDGDGGEAGDCDSLWDTFVTQDSTSGTPRGAHQDSVPQDTDKNWMLSEQSPPKPPISDAEVAKEVEQEELPEQDEDFGPQVRRTQYPGRRRSQQRGRGHANDGGTLSANGTAEGNSFPSVAQVHAAGEWQDGAQVAEGERHELAHHRHSLLRRQSPAAGAYASVSVAPASHQRKRNHPFGGRGRGREPDYLTVDGFARLVPALLDVKDDVTVFMRMYKLYYSVCGSSRTPSAGISGSRFGRFARALGVPRAEADLILTKFQRKRVVMAEESREGYLFNDQWPGAQLLSFLDAMHALASHGEHHTTREEELKAMARLASLA